MTNYYIEKENKIVNVNTDKQLFINTYGEDAEILETERPLVLSEDGTYYVFADTDEYLQEQANKIRNELIEQVNYPLKAKVAYTGVRFDYEGQELVFETNETSISMVNFTAMMAQQAGLSNISNWKCRKTVEPFEPVSVTFTMAQFQQLLTFASQMVLQSFAVEEQINLQIQELTVEQLNNAEFIETFKQQMELAYAKVPVKLEGLFVEQPVEEVTEDETDEVNSEVKTPDEGTTPDEDVEY